MTERPNPEHLPMISLLTGIILALAGGQNLGAILAGLSLPQWMQLVTILLQAEPEILKAFSELDPTLKRIEVAISAGNTNPKHLAKAAYNHLGMGM